MNYANLAVLEELHTSGRFLNTVCLFRRPRSWSHKNRPRVLGILIMAELLRVLNILRILKVLKVVKLQKLRHTLTSFGRSKIVKVFRGF